VLAYGLERDDILHIEVRTKGGQKERSINAMSYSEEQLDKIYSRSSGYCHICHKKLARTNYANFGSRGAWEVEHSRARMNGGGDHGNNLFAACISCNRRKGIFTTVTARGWHGKRRAPLSRSKRAKTIIENSVAGAVIGGMVGAIFGPPGVLFGGAIGGYAAASRNPDHE
jgi:5-methylcytosine-specific restriction endonuclease McrA